MFSSVRSESSAGILSDCVRALTLVYRQKRSQDLPIICVTNEVAFGQGVADDADGRSQGRPARTTADQLYPASWNCVSSNTRVVMAGSASSVGSPLLSLKTNLVVRPLQFPIGMGTGAVYLTLSVLKVPEYRGLDVIKNIFWYLCIVFFLLNIATLVTQLLREWPSHLHTCRHV